MAEKRRSVPSHFSIATPMPRFCVPESSTPASNTSALSYFVQLRIAVIGIGNPEKLTHVSDLVKMSTELLLYQNYFTYELEGNIRSQELFLEELLKSEPSKSFIQHLSNQLNTNLLTFGKCIIINIEKQIFSKKQYVGPLTYSFSYVLLFPNLSWRWWNDHVGR